MRCAQARSLWIERDVGPLAARAETLLDLHLVHCAECSAWAAQAAHQGLELRALHIEAPFAVDVTARVLEELTALPAPRSEEVRTGVLAWTSLAALAATAGLAAALWTLLPSLGRTASGVWLTLRGLRPAVAALVETAGTRAAPLLRAAASAARAVSTAGPSPAVSTAIALALIVMASTVIFVVGRDLRRPASQREEQRP